MGPQARNWRDTFALIFMVLFLASAPVVAWFHSDTPLDALRWFVIAQATVVIALYLYALVQAIVGILKELNDTSVDRIAKQLRYARTSGIIVVILLTAEQIYQIVAFRLGQHHLDPRTPVLQIALLFAVVEWGWMHLRSFRPERRTPVSNVQRALQVASEAEDKD